MRNDGMGCEHDGEKELNRHGDAIAALYAGKDGRPFIEGGPALAKPRSIRPFTFSLRIKV